MSKKAIRKKSVREKNTEQPKKSKRSEQELTPWQKENLEYLKQQGSTPQWNISLLTEEVNETDVLYEVGMKTESDESQISEDETGKQETEKQIYESFADRLPKIKQVRNKRLYRRLTFIISIFMIAILTVIYFVSPLSKLGDISVTGNHYVPSQQIIKLSTLEKGASLWGQFKSRKIYAKQLENQLPRVKKARIHFSGLHSFAIEIDEYEVTAMASKNSVYYPVLENGETLSEELKTPQAGMPVIQNFEEPKVIKELMEFYSQLDEKIKQNILEVRYTPTEANKELINFLMKDRNIVVINIPDINDKMQYYQEIVNQTDGPGTIDMEVGVTYTPFATNDSMEAEEKEGG